VVLPIQPQPISGEIDVVNEVKKDLVAIRAGHDINPEFYRTLLTLAAQAQITMDGTEEENLDQVFSKMETLIEARAEVGEAKYGRRLQTNNGRNPLQDLLEELLDACNYMKQCLLEKRF
jgi:hypothetical protein